MHNIRNCSYFRADDYIVHYYEKTFDLGKLTSVDFIVIPFSDLPGVAHSMLSFGFEDRDYLGVSVEIRKEKGEQYDAVKGFLRQYELIYNVADERDLIQKYAVHQKYDVYVYRARATPAQARWAGRSRGPLRCRGGLCRNRSSRCLPVWPSSWQLWKPMTPLPGSSLNRG